MIDYKFEDYINLYKNINSVEWIVLYEESEIVNSENDIFGFCAIKDIGKVNSDNYMQKPDWEFSVDDFGKSTFYSNGLPNNGDIIFHSGIYYNDYEYLIALRSFDKYEKCIEINPKLIWYGNLVKVNGGYSNPITDEQIIRVSKNKIEVRREYLKDFLSAYNKVCVIVFDHKRYFNKNENIKYGDKDICEEGFFASLSIAKTNICGTIISQYDSYSYIIGKAIVVPFNKPHHEDYKYLAEEKQYESFITGYLEDEDKQLVYTCNKELLANFFGANPEAPCFLTPIYFDIKVLDKYKHDPKNYEINDSNIMFLRQWSIPFNINEENKVVVWLGDLGNIPFDEQKYWKVFNINPKGGIEKKFFQRQMMGLFTDESRIETKLLLLIEKFNDYINYRYNDIMFKRLSPADEEIYRSFMLPTNLSISEYQSFLMKLSKLTAESINVNLIKRIMGDNYNSEIKGSVLQLGEFLKFTKIDVNGGMFSSIKKAYDSRNKLAAHKGSFGEYNKLWGRGEDHEFKPIDDAKELLEHIIDSIESLIERGNSID